MKYLSLPVAAILGISVCVFATELPMKKAVLRCMDKITGRVSMIQVSVGHTAKFGDLSIDVKKCYTRSPEDTPENSAYLEIIEHKKDKTVDDVFTGWMFSSNPALSAMEHPVYDVWVVSCTSDTVEPTADMPIIDADEIDIENPVEVEDDNPALAEEEDGDEGESESASVSQSVAE